MAELLIYFHVGTNALSIKRARTQSHTQAGVCV